MKRGRLSAGSGKTLKVRVQFSKFFCLLANCSGETKLVGADIVNLLKDQNTKTSLRKHVGQLCSTSSLRGGLLLSAALFPGAGHFVVSPAHAAGKIGNEGGSGHDDWDGR